MLCRGGLSRDVAAEEVARSPSVLLHLGVENELITISTPGLAHGGSEVKWKRLTYWRYVLLLFFSL